MKATVTIDLNNPMALPLLGFLESLPFATVKKSGQTPPCQYTVEELRERIFEAEADIAAGLFIPHEEIKRKTL